MRKFIYMLLSAIAVEASAQDVKINMLYGNAPEWNNIPTKEIGKITHIDEGRGQGSLVIDLISGPSVTLDPNEIKDITVSQPMDLSKSANGTLIEITNEADYLDTDFIDVAYPASDYYGIFNRSVQTLNTTLKNSGGRANPYTIYYHVYDFTYVSSDYDGQKIPLSGRVIFPYNKKEGDNRVLMLSKVFLENHYTTFMNSESPTSSFENQQFSGMAAKGYLVIQPDYLGFGASQNRMQLFVDQENHSRHVVDCVIAAKQLVNYATAYGGSLEINVSSDATMLNEGISQGSSSAMGVMRFYENNMIPSERAKMFPMEETRIIAGPYSPMLTLEKFFEWEQLYYCPVVPLLVQSALINHPDLMVDDKGNPLTLHDFFSEKMFETRYSDYDNMNIFEMLASKKFGSGPLRRSMWRTAGDGENYVYMSQMMNPNLFSDISKGKLNDNAPAVKAIKRVLAISDNTNPKNWVPQGKLSMWHGPNDRFVPYECSSYFYQNMTNAGARNVTFTTVRDEGLGDHTMVCGIWMLSELLDIDMNAAAIILSEVIKRM